MVRTESKSRPRKRAVARHRSFKLTKKKIKQPKPILGPVILTRQSIAMLGNNKTLFFGAALIYAALSFILVQGLGATFNLTETKQQIDEVFGNSDAKISTSVTLFGYLLGSFGSQSVDTSGTYQVVLSLITMLAVIWLARQVMSGQKPQLRDAYYKGMYPIIPFLLVLLVIGLQLLPAAIGNFMYTMVISQGIAVSMIEKVLWLLLFLLLSLLSLYMVTSSIFALYIVTLPDTRPIQALKSARDIVMHRRLGIAARLLLLPILLIIIGLIIFVPLLMTVPVLVEPLFLVASAIALVYATLYSYSLYRSLL